MNYPQMCYTVYSIKFVSSVGKHAASDSRNWAAPSKLKNGFWLALSRIGYNLSFLSILWLMRSENFNQS